MKTEKHILMDMDGVIVRGATVIPGAPEFIARLVAAGRKFLVLTNNPAYTPRDLSARLTRLGYSGGLSDALPRWAGVENLEELVEGLRRIDPVVLDALRAQSE